MCDQVEERGSACRVSVLPMMLRMRSAWGELMMSQSEASMMSACILLMSARKLPIPAPELGTDAT